MANLTQDQLDKVNYLRVSVRLQDPNVETDPVYIFTDDQLWDILEKVAPSHCATYPTIYDVPENEFQFVILLGKREIFYRLAVSTAPFYPLAAEGANLQRNVRFDHYLSLVKEVEQNYKDTYASWQNNAFGVIQTYEVMSQAEYFHRRAFNVANKPTVKMTLSNITSTTVDIDWTKYVVQNGLFARYSIFAEKTPMVDEYKLYRRRTNASPVMYFFDIHRLKYRVGELRPLEPDTDYYISVFSEDRNGLYGYDEQLIHTLPLN
jgi:hypothetical protein